MGRIILGAAVIVTVWAGTTVGAQKVTNPAEYAMAMKTIGGAFGDATRMIGAGAMEEAKARVATSRSAMTTVEQFWVERKNEAAAAIAKDSVMKLEALERALTGLPVNTLSAEQYNRIQAATAQTQATCGACHSKYREQDPATKAFGFKAGVL